MCGNDGVAVGTEEGSSKFRLESDDSDPLEGKLMA